MKLAQTLMNAVPVAVLRSPLHRVMSARYALLRMHGRRSGRRITVPVAYVRDRGRIVLSTDSPWRPNASGGRSVQMLVRGRWHTGTAHRVVDRPEANRLLQRLVHEVPGYARPAGLAGADDLDAAITTAVQHERWVLGVVTENER